MTIKNSDEPFLTLVNKIGTPCSASPIFVIFSILFIFLVHGTKIVLDSNYQIHKESNIDEKEHAMGFLTNTIVSYDIKKTQHHFLLDQVIDLNTLM